MVGKVTPLGDRKTDDVLLKPGGGPMLVEFNIYAATARSYVQDISQKKLLDIQIFLKS